MLLSFDESPRWSEIDYSNCKSIEFSRLFQKLNNYFLGYGSRSYEDLVDELMSRIVNYKFKNGEADVILRFIDEHLLKLTNYKVYFRHAEYQKVLMKLLNILSHLLEANHNIYRLESKDLFQALVFNLTDQLDLESDLLRSQKNLKVLSFKNFDLTFVQNKNKLPIRTFSLPLIDNLSSNLNLSTMVTLGNLTASDSKWIFLVYKVNHFLSKKDFPIKE